LHKNTAVKIPTGAANKSARAVTDILARIIGNIPYKLLVGRQVIPKIKSKKPILNIAGTPPAKRNRHIKITQNIHTAAEVKKRKLAIFSLKAFIVLHHSS
jgi:hypothetical protein